MNRDIGLELQAVVKEAIVKRQPLAIRGGGSKSFLQSAPVADKLEIRGHVGVIAYEPSELFITARAGTPLAAIEAMLKHHNQMLGCEPPHYDDGGGMATLGGAVACGFSGSRRPFAGAMRDHVLGVQVLGGEGELMQFGGQVMKNVAGFDVSRLMVGARGTLGALLEITLKVLPRPEAEETLVFECPLREAPERMSKLSRRALPLSGLAWVEGHIFLRLEGTDAAIRSAQTQIGGELAAQGSDFWETLREQTHPFFRRHLPLWRLSLPPAAALAPLQNDLVMDWAGGLRWWHTDQPAAEVEALAHEYGGFAYLFRNMQAVLGNAPPAGLLAVHQRLKQAFDPHGIFNPGVMRVSG
ncbi:MAG TPA: glycolate oxidase subunit GlcE [Methylophilaceae bacterium]|nr:glycolate oxidase subunit GlcE [Methylophilaceae bacterium]